MRGPRPLEERLPQRSLKASQQDWSLRIRRLTRALAGSCSREDVTGGAERLPLQELLRKRPCGVGNVCQETRSRRIDTKAKNL